MISDNINKMLNAEFNYINNKNRKIQHNEFRALLDNDYEEIKKIVAKYYVKYIETDKKPISKETFENLVFYHQNIITKYLNRQTAGIINDPKRYIQDKDFNLKEVLPEDYNEQIQQTLIRSKWFNVCLAKPVMRNEQLEVDIISPDMIEEILPTQDLKRIQKIKISTADVETGEQTFTVWTETEHYLIIGSNIVAPENNPKMVNPYGKVPYIPLKMENETVDFYGEPDWTGFWAQLETDIKMSAFNKAEIHQSFPIAIAVNLDLQEGQRLTPGMVLNAKDVKVDNETPSLNYYSAGTDWNSLQQNIDNRIDNLYISKGLSSNSITKETNQTSGISKLVDELELEESRNLIKNKLISFEVELLDMVRLVMNNEKPNTIIDGEFIVEYGENKAKESESDKKIRMERQKALGIKDEIDFIQEELELSEEDAIKYYEVRKQRALTLGINKNNRIESLFNRSQNGTTGNDNIQA